MSARRAAIVFCEQPRPGTWAAGVLRSLATWIDVRACGPGWPARDVTDVPAEAAAFLLELDTAPAFVARPRVVGPAAVLPRVSWLVDTSRKPALHRTIAAESSVVFHAHRAWASSLGCPSTWLPLCADEAVFAAPSGGAAERDWDAVFVGHETWRAESLATLAARRGLRVHVAAPEGPTAKVEAARLFARAKLVVHVHAAPDLDPRVFEALAAGRLVVVDPRPNGLEDLVRTGEHAMLHKGPAELEARLMELLADDDGRLARERQAAAWARERLVSTVRARELLEAIDRGLGLGLGLAVVPPTGFVSTPEPAPQLNRLSRTQVRSSRPRPSTRLTPTPTGRRWLVLADREPVAVQLASYAERVAERLRARGDDVTVVRLRRGRLASPGASGDGQTLIEVDPGPLPRSCTAENDVLLASAALQRVADQVAREHGPFAAVLAEPPVGAVVGVSLAARCGAPLALLLEDCEVARRGNALTRDQLYRSELEHWAADRACLVIVPSEAAEQAVRKHYEAGALVTTGWPSSEVVVEPGDAARLRGRLSIPEDALLVRAPRISREAGAGLLTELARRGICAVVLTGAGILVRRGERNDLLAPEGVVGAALAGLALGADVVQVGRVDLGAADLAPIARSFAVAGEATADEILAVAKSSQEPLARWRDAVLDVLLAAVKAPALALAGDPS